MRDIRCDKCFSIIKDNSPRRILICSKPITEKEQDEITDYIEAKLKGQISNNYSSKSYMYFETLELCEACYKIHEAFFNLREEEVRGMHESFKKITEKYYDIKEEIKKENKEK